MKANRIPAPNIAGWLLSLCLLIGLQGLQAAEQESKPFADKHVVLQISDPNPFKQTLVLNVASNLLKHYGPDRVDLEIVAFGPGLRLLQAENANEERIDGLVDQGVRFSACENTIRGFAKNLGKEPLLHQHAIHVSAGVVRILDLIEQDYVLIKP